MKFDAATKRYEKFSRVYTHLRLKNASTSGVAYTCLAKLAVTPLQVQSALQSPNNVWNQRLISSLVRVGCQILIRTFQYRNPCLPSKSPRDGSKRCLHHPPCRHFREPHPSLNTLTHRGGIVRVIPDVLPPHQLLLANRLFQVRGAPFSQSCVRWHLRQGPICDLDKGTYIIVNTCRIIKQMCLRKTLNVKF